MKQTIARLWNGDLSPIQHFGVNDTEIKQLEELMQRAIEKAEQNLDEAQKKMFENYMELVNEYIIVITENAFCDGFCMGSKILVEALS